MDVMVFMVVKKGDGDQKVKRGLRVGSDGVAGPIGLSWFSAVVAGVFERLGKREPGLPGLFRKLIVTCRPDQYNGCVWVMKGL
jgi:hypothetical protein